jgi:hypothetical protein
LYLPDEVLFWDTTEDGIAKKSANRRITKEADDFI